MPVKQRSLRGRTSPGRWASLTPMIAIIALAAMCLLTQPTRAIAAPTSALAADPATTGAMPKRSDPRALLFLGNMNIAPVIYLDGNVPAGLAVDLVRALATHMSRRVEVVAMNWKQAQALVTTGAADALIQINETPERRQVYDFSDPFLESHFAIFVRQDQTGIFGTSSLHGLRVGVESGGLPEQLLGTDPEIPLTVIPGFPEGFRMLKAGTIDAVVVDYRVGSYVLAANHINNIKVVGDPVASSYSSIAVRKGDTALLTEINGALRTIKADGTYQRILDSWAPTVGVFETQAQIDQRVFYGVSITLLALLVTTAVWAAIIRIQVRRKREAEEALQESEEIYRSLVAAMAEGVVFRGADGRITAVNPAAQRIEGRSAEQMIGPTAEDPRMGSVREDGTPFPEESYPSEVTLRTGEPQHEVVMGVRRPDGALVWISVNSQPVLSVGVPGSHAVVTTFRDVTESKLAEAELDRRGTRLEELLAEREKNLIQLGRSFSSIIEVVGQVVETRDPYTAGHQRRVSELAVRISEEMGVSAEVTEEIRVAALIHDVGKMSVPAEILSKPGSLSSAEFQLVKDHAEAGYRIVASTNMTGPTAEIIRQHHERCDGSGYPRGLTADHLLPAAKVLMVADVVEAMASHRPYRAALGVDAALDEIAGGAGRLYDAEVCRACRVVFLERGFEFTPI